MNETAKSATGANHARTSKSRKQLTPSYAILNRLQHKRFPVSDIR